MSLAFTAGPRFAPTQRPPEPLLYAASAGRATSRRRVEGRMSLAPGTQQFTPKSPAAPAWDKGPPPEEVRKFLQGPQPRGFELARAVGIFFEFLRGFRTFHFL